MRRFAFSCLLLFAAGSVVDAGPIKLGKRYRDESNGFQVSPPSKWEQVPTKFQDVVTLGKWVAKRAKRGYYTPSMYVVRFFKPKGAAAGESPADVAKRGMPGRGGMMRSQPKNVWEFVERFLGKSTVVEDVPDFRMSRSKKFKAHLKVYHEQIRGSGRDLDKRQTLCVAARIESRDPASDAIYGVVFFATIADMKDVLRPFKTIIKRFRILEDDDEDEEGGVSDADIFVDSETKPDIWREARRRKLIKGWGAIDTKNYLIVYNKEVKRPLLKKIAKHIEAIREQIYQNLFPPSREIKAVSVVRVCKDIKEYHSYGGPPGSAGYWSRGDEELVVPAGMSDSIRVLYHEAFHQYIHYAVGDVSPHSWFNEGHGDYFAGFNYRGKKFKPAPFRWRTGIIATALSSKSYVPLKKFLKYTQGEYYANAGLCYAQGWSFVYFLREIERRKIKKYKQYWGLLDRYFDGIKRNVKSVKENAFEGLDPKKPKPAGPNPFDPVEPEKEEPGPPRLPRLPGLEQPFPGENPDAGAGPDPKAKRTGETKSVAGPRITGTKSALDAAVDEVFGKIDIEKLEKDWVEWSKKGGR